MRRFVPVVVLLLACGTPPPAVQESKAVDGAVELADLLRVPDVDGALDRFLFERGLSDARAAWERRLLAEELRGFVEVMGVPESLKSVKPRTDLVREGVALARRISPQNPRLYFYTGKSVFLTHDGARHLIIGFVCNSGRCRVTEVAWGVPADAPGEIGLLRKAHAEASRRRWDFVETNPRPE